MHRRLFPLPLPLALRLIAALALCLLALNTVGLWMNLRDLAHDSARAERAWTTITTARRALGLVLDAETSQRGYLLTGETRYLAPLLRARSDLDGTFARLADVARGDQVQVARLEAVRNAVARRMTQIERSIAVRTASGLPPAIKLIEHDEGRRTMDEIRTLMRAFEREEQRQLDARHAERYGRYHTAAWTGIGIAGIIALVLVTFCVVLARNLTLQRAARASLRAANADLEARIGTRTQQVALLSRHLLERREAEKAALASELHDELGTNLTAVNFDLSSVVSRLGPQHEKLVQRLRRATGALREIVDLKRRIIHNLRPSTLDSLGLAATLRAFGQEFAQRSGIDCEMELPEDHGPIDGTHAVALFRVAQEALANVQRHAVASRVRLALVHGSDEIALTIEDDGVGLPVDAFDRQAAYGLLGMRERIEQLGGRFVARVRRDGRGTTISAVLPVAPA